MHGTRVDAAKFASRMRPACNRKFSSLVDVPFTIFKKFTFTKAFNRLAPGD
jgi:hypothetical protein